MKPDMCGYGRSSKPREVEFYSADALADDMMAIAAALGARQWVAVGHDWGAPVAWRCALRQRTNGRNRDPGIRHCFQVLRARLRKGWAS